MASAATPPPDAEPPECPVCLSPFDATSAVPRVLPCGHSLCGPCIASLPPALASASAASFRCPLCLQCVPYSRALGPSSLPKNLALLSLLPSPPNPSSSRAAAATAAPCPLYLPLHADHSHILSRFHHAVLPESASPLPSTPPRPTAAALAIGSLTSDLGPPWFCARGDPVSLLPVEVPTDGAPTQESSFYRPSHAARVVAAIDTLSSAAREEVFDLVAASARLARRVCRVYGVWMGPEEAPLWMVSERHSRGVSGLLEERSGGEEMVAQIRAVGMEVCEAFMGLHGEGLVLGCLGLSCFCLDRFGHCLLDLNQALALCRGVRAGVCSSKSRVFMAPEVVALLHDKLLIKDHGFNGLVGSSSDAWLLGCVLVAIVTGDEQLAAGWNTDGSYDDWMNEVLMRFDASLVGTNLEPLSAITASCLNYDPESRPDIADIWKCISGSLVNSSIGALAPNDDLVSQKSFLCLLLGELSSMCSEFGAVNSDDSILPYQDSDDKNSTLDDASSAGFINKEVVMAGMDEPQCGGRYKSSTLLAHRDCVTGLAIGGGFLFSSSYDKTINVWSLQDFSHIQSLKGHEHKITAIAVVENDSQLLCISGDSGSGIFVWCVDASHNNEPLNKWYENNDWLYRGIHCLAVSGTGYLYTGSKDKSIKAWSLEDYSLRCTMTGHKSTVSCLSVACGILYSGSWDGSIRSWWISDHNPLSVLEDGIPGSITPVLSISTEDNLVVSSYENGCLKIWKDGVLVKSLKLQNGAIYATKLNGKWLYAGGWDKILNIQELLGESEVEIRDVASITCDSIITSILYWDERLIIGLSNRDIKVCIIFVLLFIYPALEVSTYKLQGYKSVQNLYILWTTTKGRICADVEN
ncbi:hypothetical protein GUJ93_ZPchr0010g10280 [Zizania palustris]|uniref:RING-type domain-containing protein n=1 Tax=Zizania palustris TaxID=103762 RepID=A0A8J5W9Z5_ZIZPA|nr:hypothetical protein GUJ93_ZPchr0010g10280 [Zizania palustris]